MQNQNQDASDKIVKSQKVNLQQTKKHADSRTQPVITKLSDIEPEILQWLWPNRIPLGKLTLLVGNPGVGKSFLTVFMAAQVSTGNPWPDLPNERIQVGSVIILTAEDDLADTVRIRLEAAGANLEKILTIPAVEITCQNEKKLRGLYNLTKDLDVLATAIEQTADARLVIIDPISAYMGGKNSNSNTEVREYLHPLTELATESKIAIVGISHLNKNQKISAAYRTLGSIGFTAAARAVWLVAEDSNDSDRRLLIPKKGNLSKNPTGLAFRLVDVQVETKSGQADSAKCDFETGAIYTTADEVLDANNKKNKGSTKIEEAKEWIQDKLSSGPMPATEIRKQAEDAGISERTLNRAKDMLGVLSNNNREDGRINGWTWSLPDQFANKL